MESKSFPIVREIQEFMKVNSILYSKVNYKNLRKKQKLTYLSTLLTLLLTVLSQIEGFIKEEG